MHLPACSNGARRIDGDLLTHRSQGKLDVDGQVVLDVRLHALADVWRKPGSLSLQRVGAWIDRFENVIAARTGAHCLGTPVVSLVRVTVAPETTAPVESVTLPVIRPVAT